MTAEEAGASRSSQVNGLTPGTVGMFTDRHVERYWELLAIMNGWPQRGPPSTPAWEWLPAALRAAG